MVAMVVVMVSGLGMIDMSEYLKCLEDREVREVEGGGGRWREGRLGGTGRAADCADQQRHVLTSSGWRTVLLSPQSGPGLPPLSSSLPATTCKSVCRHQ